MRSKSAFPSITMRFYVMGIMQKRLLIESGFIKTNSMKQFDEYTFNDFVRVPRAKTSEVTMTKRHRHTPIKVKSCTINLNDGIHVSRPLSEVLR